MALIQADFYSECLKRTVTINACIPADKVVFGKGAGEKRVYPTLYLLHGIVGNYTDWVAGTRILRWAQDRNLAVIMPSGDNHFYVDDPKGRERYGEFIGRELVEVTRRLFPLSEKREETFIAGLSMGGYGAIRNGLKYHETFSRIAGLSSALILDDVVISVEKPEDWLHSRSFYESIFGNLDQLKGSDRDYCALVSQIVEQNGRMPEIYLCCGKDDFLIEQNRAFRDFLTEMRVPFTYEEGEGAHEWDYWDRKILDVLNWLPLEEKEEGISSGNVKQK